MKFDNLIEILTENSIVEEVLIKQVRNLHRRVRMAGNKVYRLHLSNDTLPKNEYRQKLNKFFTEFVKQRNIYHSFLQVNKNEIMNHPKLLEIIKDFRAANPIVFENDPLKN